MKEDITLLAVQEYSSLASGTAALDALVKEAPVTILGTRIVTPGKFLILLTGDVASVEAALNAGREVSRESLIGELFIPNLHPDVVPALTAKGRDLPIDALGILETVSVASGIAAADEGAKHSDVRILEIRIGEGMGGKALVMFTGRVGEVQTALEYGGAFASERGHLIRKIIIPNPHEEMKPFLF